MTNEWYDTSLYDSLEQYVDALNIQLSSKSPLEIVQWTIETFGADHTALSSSFGITSAVMLHLVMSIDRTIPVVWIDTGYLPPETYQFAERMVQDLKIENLQVYQSPMTPARMEALYGKLWEVATPEAHQQYGYLRKVEPMQRAMRDLNTRAVLVGIRSEQTLHRESMKLVNIHDRRLKICPLLRWTTHDVDQYMIQYKLPYHPLKAQGYVSVGDLHSSRPLTSDDVPGQERASRFHGVAQECGLHVQVAVKLEDLVMTSHEHQLRQLSQQTLVVFTKPTCKYCLAAKEEFKNRGWKYREIHVGTDLSVESMQRVLGKTVQTVPQIVNQGQYIGGYTDLCVFLNIPSRFI